MINFDTDNIRLLKLDEHFYAVILDDRKDEYYVWRRSDSGTSYLGKQKRRLNSNTIISYQSALHYVIQTHSIYTQD